MAEKKKTVRPKGKVEKPPTLREKITDTSKGAFVGQPIFTPKKKSK